jgi:hypothetical protein
MSEIAVTVNSAAILRELALSRGVPVIPLQRSLMKRTMRSPLFFGW